MRNALYHRSDDEWLLTTTGKKRGYVDLERLRELWFHTGTDCNLQCQDCFEHSSPGNRRLEPLTFNDAMPVINEAAGLGVEMFSFTGGEPFAVHDTVVILDHALNLRPCLVLTNGTQPLRTKLKNVATLRNKPHALSFRVSLDYPDAGRHDARRGDGLFAMALDTLGQLHRSGFHVSVARRMENDENPDEVSAAYLPFFAAAGLPTDTPIVAFPNLEIVDSPEITETCMTTYHTHESRKNFMCAFSRMVVKHDGQVRIYACTLVDDNPCYDLGDSLAQAIRVRVQLAHPRCSTCFTDKTSCSEL